MKLDLFPSFMNWLRNPPEFRISTREYTDISTPEIVKQLHSIPNTISGIKHEEELVDVAIEIGTLIWRIKKRLDTMGELSKELTRVTRDIEAAWIALTQRGVEIEDYTGKEYVSGMLIKVAASQPVTTLSKEHIIETIKPTIYYKGKIIQMGEVIVGFPAEK